MTAASSSHTRTLRLQPRHPLNLFVDRADRLLEDDLLRWGGTDHSRQIAFVRIAPRGSTPVLQPKPQQERLQPQLGIPQRQTCGIPRAAQIADRLVLHRRHIDAGQVAGAQQPSQLDRISNSLSGPVAKAVGLIAMVLCGIGIGLSEGGGGARKLLIIGLGLSIAFSARTFWLSFFGASGGFIL